MMRIQPVLTAVLLAACLPLWAESGSDTATPTPAPEQPVTWRNAAVPGPAVKLRLMRPVGKSMIYQGSLDREQRSANSYHEVDQFYVNALCAAHEDGRDLIANLRSYLDRRRSEKLDKHKEEERLLPNTADLIDLGPNFNMVGTLRCYAFDAQNRLAYRTTQLVLLKDGSRLTGTIARQDSDKLTFVTDRDTYDLRLDKIAAVQDVPLPHVVINEAPHYLFPILTGRTVSPGETWRFRVPTIIPLEQGLGADVLPTQFDLIFNAKLREVRETPTGKVAVIDYQISGLFDSSLPEFKSRFDERFLASSRVTHKVSGEGSATLDVEKGRLLERHENFTFNFYGNTIQPATDKFDKKTGKKTGVEPAKPVENKAEIVSRFDLKLLLPGTRLKSGAIVPPYE